LGPRASNRELRCEEFVVHEDDNVDDDDDDDDDGFVFMIGDMEIYNRNRTTVSV
jgi:hypothetical protein